jgi:hypothetical protein
MDRKDKIEVREQNEAKDAKEGWNVKDRTD